MNTIKTGRVNRGEVTYVDIEVDGKRLAHHFAGRLGAHPSQLSPLGWSSATPAHRANIVSQFLAEGPSATGNDVDVKMQGGKIQIEEKGSKTEIAETTTWPQEMVKDVPKFTAGKIQRVVKTHELTDVTNFFPLRT